MTTTTPRRPVESEAAFQTWVIGTAELFGWTWHHCRNPRQDNPGFPDLWMVNAAARRLVVAELKAAGGRVSAKQSEWLRALNLAGIEAYLWFPVDRERIVKILDWARTGARLT